MNSQDSLTDKDKLNEQTQAEETPTPQAEETVQAEEVTSETPEATEAAAEPAAETITTPEPEAEKAEEVVEAGQAPEAAVSEPAPEAPAPTAEEDDMLQPEEEDADEDEEDESKTISLAELSKEELIARLRELLELDVNEARGEVESIKQLFYKRNNAEIEAQREAFIQEGGAEEDFIPHPGELEDEFKNLYNEFKAIRAKHMAELEKERESNLLRKNHIIEQIKQLTESKEDVSANINTFRQLQQEWKNTGPVAPAMANDLWRRYNREQEAFWDLIKINNELREYDFRKNLEAKNKLIENAEALDTEEDVISAFRQLQKLHEEWHELGPVARELREEIWSKFKAASSVINKKHQSHFDEIREIENKNLERKNELCEKLEAIDVSSLKTYRSWDDATKNILELQEEWRTIGFAPRKQNQKVFERYRAACDRFFASKAEFYKNVKAEMAENLEKKKALCEKAEAMKESTDWKATTDEFIKIQKEWKTIGPVQKKYSDEVWKRFIGACDYFFEQRNKNVSGRRSEELKNMELKKAIIKKIKAFSKSDNVSESLANLRALSAEWNSVGHVPYKEKDKMYKAYRTALDEKFDELNIDVSQRRMESFRSNLKDMSTKGENKLYRERDKLMRAYENLKSEIATYENNIGFLSISSKKGGGMLQEMERKINSLKEECKMLEDKINLIDEQL